MRWNVDLYDSKHEFVSAYGGSLIKWLDPKPNESILDVGCGTGDLAFQIASLGAKVIGTDAASEMIDKAICKYPHMEFLHIDGTQLPFIEQFDAVFSNATFHWIRDQDNLISSVYQSLKANGRLVAEFGGKGNIFAIRSAITQAATEMGVQAQVDLGFWYFPAIGEYTALLERHGFEVEQAWLYDRPTPLVGDEGMEDWLNQFGQNAWSALDEDQQEELKQRTIAALTDTLFINREWIADYRRLRIKAVKKLAKN